MRGSSRGHQPNRPIHVDDERSSTRNARERRSIMHATLRNGLVTAGILLLGMGTTALADTVTVMEANVPVPFVVNGHEFPAGKYLVERESSSVLLIRGEHKNHNAIYVAAVPDAGRDPGGSRPTLVLKERDGAYRLTSVWESQSEGWDVTNR